MSGAEASIINLPTLKGAEIKPTPYTSEAEISPLNLSPSVDTETPPTLHTSEAKEPARDPSSSSSPETKRVFHGAGVEASIMDWHFEPDVDTQFKPDNYEATACAIVGKKNTSEVDSEPNILEAAALFRQTVIRTCRKWLKERIEKPPPAVNTLFVEDAHELHHIESDSIVGCQVDMYTAKRPCIHLGVEEDEEEPSECFAMFYYQFLVRFSFYTPVSNYADFKWFHVGHITACEGDLDPEWGNILDALAMLANSEGSNPVPLHRYECTT